MGARVMQVAKNENGAALATAMAFFALVSIFLTSMVVLTTNEIGISARHRDAVQAMDLAQGGIQEAIVRMQAGRPYTPGFTSSLNPGVTVTVVRKLTGANAAYQEIQADATAGLARRHLSALVLQRMLAFPPNVALGDSLSSTGAAQITGGDAYARSFIQYKTLPTDPNSISYAGWRISKVDPGAIPFCYSNATCGGLGQPKWYPAQRRTNSETTALGQDIKGQTNKCAAGGGGTLPTATFAYGGSTGLASDPCPGGVCASSPPGDVNQYGFDTDNPGVGPQAVTPALPCGLPYKWVQATFLGEDGVTSYTRWFKEIVFEQWFQNYWQFDPSQMTYVKTTSLITYPQFSAIPPFPATGSFEGNFDRILTGGGTINSGDFGCKYPEMACTPAVDRPIIVLLDNSSWTINGTLQGHGTLVVDGNLTINGGFTYWGTILVNGTLTLGSGTATIYGGLVARSTITLSGTITVSGGGTVSNVPVGRSVVVKQAWWER